MNYFSVRAILAEEERVPVNFNTAVSGLGRQLDPSTSDEDLSVGSGVELPLWLIPHLASRNMVRVRMRKCFGERARRELEAGPSKVALRDHCKYYYIMGSSLCELLQRPMLGRLLMYTFRERYGALLLKAFISKDSDIGTTVKLTREEEELFEVARYSTRIFDKWRRTTSARITPSEYLSRKRKLPIGTMATPVPPASG